MHGLPASIERIKRLERLIHRRGSARRPVEHSAVASRRKRRIVHRLVDGRFLHHCESRGDLRRHGRLLDRIPVLRALLVHIDVAHHVPFVEMRLGGGEAALVENLAAMRGVNGDTVDGERRLQIKMPGEEIDRRFARFHPIEKIFGIFCRVVGPLGEIMVALVHCVESDRTVASDLDVRKAFFEMLGRRFVKFEELLLRALVPHAPVRLGFVPDFPVFDIPPETVGPSLVVVGDDVFADARPFRRILRRNYVVWLHFARPLDRRAQPVVRLHADLDHGLEIRIGEREVVVLRIVLVRVEIRKHVRNVDVMVKTVASGDIVQPAVRNAGLSELRLRLVVDFIHRLMSDRRTVDAVQRLHLAARL